MSESKVEQSPAQNEPDEVSSIHPSPFDLGVAYQGAILEGSLRIKRAKEVQQVHVDKLDGQDVLELSQKGKTGREGLIWTFRVRADRPIKYLGFVGFWTDRGKTCTHFSVEVKEGSAPGGRILFYHSPY